MSWHRDSNNTSYTTSNGQPANTYGMPVTVANGTGQLNNGTWNGTAAVLNKG